jgi:hypothetical protein
VRKTAVARVVNLARWHGEDDPRMAEARRDLRAAELEDHIRRLVDAAPPLTDDQRRRLASLIVGGQ